MTATYEQARDDMLALVKAAWDPTGYKMAWPDVPDSTIPPTTEVPWARTTIRYAGGGQRGFGDTVKRYERVGVLIVEVYCKQGDGLSKAYQLAKIVGDALDGQATSRGVWFRNVRLAQVGEQDGGYTRVNVLADFSYDEVK